jgi:hypothetical protein
MLASHGESVQEIEDEFRDVDLGDYIQVQGDLPPGSPQSNPQSNPPQWAMVTVLCSVAGSFVSAILLLAQHSTA